MHTYITGTPFVGTILSTASAPTIQCVLTAVRAHSGDVTVPTHMHTSSTPKAILMEFPDSHFRNTVIECGRAGVINRGGANTFHELHIWTSCTGSAGTPSSPNETVAFSEEAGGGTRISDMYIDNGIMEITGHVKSPHPSSPFHPLRFVVSQGRTPLFDSCLRLCYIDNVTPHSSRYRGTTITNSLFNGGSALRLAPNNHGGAKTINASDPSCQYWKGAVCSLIVTNNHFNCANANACATIDVADLVTTQARMVFLEHNAFEDAAAAVCTAPAAKHRCSSEEECQAFFIPCDEG